MGLLTEIAELAKAGYTPQEVRDLLTLAANPEKLREQEKSPEQKPETMNLSESEEKEKKPEPEQISQGSGEPSKDPLPDPSGDQSKEIEELKKQLAKAQADNVKKDISGQVKTDEDILADIVKSFM